MPGTISNTKSKASEYSVDDALNLLMFYADGDPYQTIKSGQLMAKAWSKSLDDPEKVFLTRIFLHRLMTTYWNEIFCGQETIVLPKLFERLESNDLDESVIAVAMAIGKAAARISTIEANYHLGRLYSSLLPDTMRSSNGIFYTPPQLVSRLISIAENAGTDFSSGNVLDPACGAGAFLVQIAIKMAEQKKDLDAAKAIEQIGLKLTGMELDPFSGWMAQVFVEVSLKELVILSGIRLKRIITIGNSLAIKKQTEKQRFNLVIGNPPFGKYKLDSMVREKFSESLYGHANLYGMFFHLSLGLAKKSGIVALLTPTSYLSGEYFKNLRALLLNHANAFAFDFIDFRKGVFEDVLQETMLSVYKKGITNKSYPEISQITTGLSDGLKIETIGTFNLPEINSLPWILPKNYSQAPAVISMQRLKSRLSDWGYKVSTGQLVWNRHKNQLTNRPSKNTLPIIWAESISRNGNFNWKTEKKNHAAYFRFEPSNESLLTRKSCVILQRTTAKEQHKRLIAALLPQSFIDSKRAVVIENHLNMVIPIIEKPLVSAEVLSAFLNSAAVNEAFRSMSGSVAVSAYEMESFPLPDAVELTNLTSAVEENEHEEIEKCCKLFYNPA